MTRPHNIAYRVNEKLESSQLKPGRHLQLDSGNFGATLSTSQEQRLSEKLQQVRLHLDSLREAVHQNGSMLDPEVSHAMQSSISGASRTAAEAKELAEILKARLSGPLASCPSI